MSWPTVKFKMDPSAFIRTMSSASSRFEDWRDVWMELAPFITDVLSGALESQGSSIGASWAPLSLASIRRKSRLGIPPRPLYDSGRTFALMANPSEGMGGAIRMMTARQLRLGPTEGYQFAMIRGTRGSGRGRRSNIPGRPFVGMTDAIFAKTIQLMEGQSRRVLEQLRAELSSGRPT